MGAQAVKSPGLRQGEPDAGQSSGSARMVTKTSNGRKRLISPILVIKPQQRGWWGLDPRPVGRSNLAWAARRTALAPGWSRPTPNSIEKRIPGAAGLEAGQRCCGHAGRSEPLGLGLSDEEWLSSRQGGFRVPFFADWRPALGSAGVRHPPRFLRCRRQTHCCGRPASVDRDARELRGPERMIFRYVSRTKAFGETRQWKLTSPLLQRIRTGARNLSGSGAYGIDGEGDAASADAVRSRPALFCMPSSESERIRVTESLQGTGAAAYLVRTISPAGAC